MKLAKTAGKVGVLAGNGPGFIGNRILRQRQDAANQLVLEGASPYAVDKVLTDFGLPMGPFAMADLAGWIWAGTPRRRMAKRLRDCLCEAGRRGQKTKAGLYDYDDARKASPSAVTEKDRHGFSRQERCDARARSARTKSASAAFCP